MNLLYDIIEISNEEEKEPGCRGLFFKCSVSSYLSSHNSIETRKSLRLLKRKSCPGCDCCQWMLDFLREDIINDHESDFIGTLQPGRVYEYYMRSYYDSYTGESDCEGSFREIKETK